MFVVIDCQGIPLGAHQSSSNSMALTTPPATGIDSNPLRGCSPVIAEARSLPLHGSRQQRQARARSAFLASCLICGRWRTSPEMVNMRHSTTQKRACGGPAATASGAGVEQADQVAGWPPPARPATRRHHYPGAGGQQRRAAPELHHERAPEFVRRRATHLAGDAEAAFTRHGSFRGYW